MDDYSLVFEITCLLVGTSVQFECKERSFAVCSICSAADLIKGTVYTLYSQKGPLIASVLPVANLAEVRLYTSGGGNASGLCCPTTTGYGVRVVHQLSPLNSPNLRR